MHEIFINNVEIIIGLLGLLVAAISVGTAKRIQNKQEEKKFLEELEASSIAQIEMVLRDIDEILTRKIIHNCKEIRLKDLIYSNLDLEITSEINQLLSLLSPRFAYYCSYIEKYTTNIMSIKDIDFSFQEYEKRAREILSIFEKFGYRDLSLDFATLHLKQSKTIERE